MTSTRKLWITLITLLVLSFAVLLAVGRDISFNAPPMPERVVSQTGELIYTRADMERGRQVWQSIGGMQLGSIWGHGGYVAPDWSADWLHREAVAILDGWAQREQGAARFEDLGAEQQAALQGRLQGLMRANGYDPGTRTITLAQDRAAAVRAVSAHYESLFGDDPATAVLRENYAMKNGTVADPEHRRALSAFFWWTAWAATTERPGKEVTYTNNWPSEPLVGNRPPSSGRRSASPSCSPGSRCSAGTTRCRTGTAKRRRSFPEPIRFAASS
jgi:nitric oxide reductase subunit B